MLSMVVLPLGFGQAAIARSYAQLEQSCTPRRANSHDCLEPMPTYSYHLALTSDYGADLCLNLGSWEGKNTVVIEWDGLQSRMELVGKVGTNHWIQPNRRQGRGSGIVIYSDQPIFPELSQAACVQGRQLGQVTAMDWPETVVGNAANVALEATSRAASGL